MKNHNLSRKFKNKKMINRVLIYALKCTRQGTVIHYYSKYFCRNSISININQTMKKKEDKRMNSTRSFTFFMSYI